MKDRLPAAILDRRKMGFPVPIAPWLRGSWRHLLDEYVLGERALSRGLLNATEVRRLVAEHDAGTRNHAERLWALITLEVWQRVFLDGEGAQMSMLAHRKRVA